MLQEAAAAIICSAIRSNSYSDEGGSDIAIVAERVIPRFTWVRIPRPNNGCDYPRNGLMGCANARE